MKNAPQLTADDVALASLEERPGDTQVRYVVLPVSRMLAQRVGDGSIVIRPCSSRDRMRAARILAAAAELGDALPQLTSVTRGDE